MTLLAKGNWPRLRTVVLSFHPTMDAVAIAHLSAANWRVETLKISDTSFSTDMAAELADQLINSRELDLMYSSTTAAAVSELARADWPSLRHLSLGHNYLDAVAELLGLDLTKMQELKSDTCRSREVLQRKMVSKPSVGLWPDLKFFRLSRYNITLFATGYYGVMS